MNVCPKCQSDRNESLATPSRVVGAFVLTYRRCLACDQRFVARTPAATEIADPVAPTKGKPRRRRR